MTAPLGILLFFVCLLALIALSKGPELFMGRFVGGHFRLARGSCPRRLLDELSDVGRLEHFDGVKLWVRSSAGRPKLQAKPVSPGQLQQLRNVVYRFEVSQIRAAGRRP